MSDYRIAGSNRPPRDLFKRPRRASVAEERKFRAAFLELLAQDPTRPPGPTGLARLMGLSSTHNLNGRLCYLRRQLLVEHGFRKDTRDGRWRLR